MDVNLTEYPHLKLETEIYRVNYFVHQMEGVNIELADMNETDPKRAEKEK